jgi:D-mannonate dehydratase
MAPLFRLEDRVFSAGSSFADEPAPVFASLPDVPVGEPWPRVAIRERRRAIEASGGRWRVAEPLPVHEDIKAGRGDLLKNSAYFRMTLRRLASQGVTTVVYDFTPASDRDRHAVSSFAEDAARERYAGVGPAELALNLRRFLESVVVTATVLGVGLALRPDDPSLPTLGLPRVASSEAQIASILAAVDLPANGLCFWAGALGARGGVDLAAVARRFAPRVHAAHLDGGSCPAVERVLLDERARRRALGRADWRLPVAPAAPGRVVAETLARLS